MKTAKLLKIYMKAQECSSPKQAKKLIKKYANRGLIIGLER